jgi:hypothetical protein
LTTILRKIIMKKTKFFKWKITASLCLALQIVVSSVSASLVMTGSYQQSASDFTPTWTVAPSLIAGMSPSAQAGNFTSEANTPGVSALTDGVIGPVSASTFDIYAAGGSGAGTTVTYALPVQANGYNLTNITVYSGWANGGRVGQAYTVLYSTVANPGNFIWLTNVSYSAGFSGNNPNNPIAIQVQLSDSLGGVIAANVAAIQFDFTCPSANDENGGTGYSEITVQGTPAASVVSPVVSITTSNENGSNPFTPTWTAETPDLIAGLDPSTTNGNFNADGNEGDISVLTDGVIGTSGSASEFASCGASGGTTLIYTLANSPNGSDVTNIVVYSGWGDTGRDGQYYSLSYSTVTAPTTYIPITTVFYLPEGVSGAQANRVAITTSTGAALAQNVANVKFDFGAPPGASSFNNGWQGYSEIIVQGTNSAPPTAPPSPILVQDTLPDYAETVVGDQVVLTAAFSNSPPVNLQWQQIVSSPAATNNINTGVLNATNNGVVTSTLTLNNVQLTSSGSYRLEGLSATNGAAAPSYSSATPLVVGSVPAPVNNIIMTYAAQTAPTTFYPPWTVNTNIDLIYGFPTDESGNPGTATAGSGNYGVDGGTLGDPTILVDGIVGNLGPQLVTCGPGGGASMTYDLILSSASKGYDLTNITVYGGWGDAGRDEQKYQVLYTTVSAPTTYVPLLTTEYDPANPHAERLSNRTTLVPASGVMANNVISLEFIFDGPSNGNGYQGYSEITVGGTPSTVILAKPTLTQDVVPLTAATVVGDSLTLTASFDNATSYQWQKNGTNISGANSPTLVLSNLKVIDTATAEGYSLVASNSAGGSRSSSCALTVNPVPAPVANAIVSMAAQTELATSFTPDWDSSMLTSSLLYNVAPSTSGNGSFTAPYDQGQGASAPAVLTDGSFGTIDYAVSGDYADFSCIGSDPNAGNFVTYVIPGSANGYTITNITSYGGWGDGGRDAQAYTVYYSTVAQPTNFIKLAVVNYLPVNPTGISVTRATITPSTGALATNVAGLYFDFTSPAGENGYEGYSEIAVYGSPSGPLVIAPPIRSITQSGGNLIVTGAGGYPPNSSYTWLTTTNLSAPIIWTTNSTGTLDATGSFSNAIPIDLLQKASFFRLRIP